MTNMSYCRFQNTLTDLLDCLEALENPDPDDELSEREEQAKRRLIYTCAEIAERFDSR